MEILFKRTDDSPDLVFVEVEDGQGNSINVGEWSERDGYSILTIGSRLHDWDLAEIRARHEASEIDSDDRKECRQANSDRGILLAYFDALSARKDHGHE